ncbi:MAG: SH3 domain-containing protein, partial [Lachnospiraceae bacterium]|nr:SH3 domain-containing protein [Lachnospiraceae bacterium]
MAKKAFLWAKTTELWIVLAQIYTVSLCFFLAKNQLIGVGGIDQIVALAAIFLLIVLTFRYELYKTLPCKLYMLFLAFTYVSGYVVGAPLEKLVGSQIQRNWYLFLTVMVVGYILKDKKKDRWINTMCAVEATILAVIFPISIYGGIQKLLNPDYQVLRGFGTFVNGRISTFGSANNAGPTAGVLILLSLILIYRSRELRLKPVLNVLYSLYILIGWAELGLSRSRGAIVATSAAIGVYFFVITYDKVHGKRMKALAAAFGICVVTTAISVAAFCFTKNVFDKGLLAYVESEHSDETERVKEGLEAYGLTYAIENLTDRTDIWRATIRMLNEKPERWIWGMTSQRILERPILDIYETRPEISMNTAHNGYLEQLYIFGIPGASILAVLVCIWVVYLIKTVFSPDIATKEKIMVILMTAAFINALVEAYLFPHFTLYPISFFFFMAEGCVEGNMDNKTSSITKRIIVSLCAVTLIALVALLTRYVYLRSKAEYEAVKAIEIKEQNPNDYVRLNNGITSEMMKAEYWTKLRSEAGADMGAEKLSLAEIERFNNLNKRMVATDNVSFSLEEIDDSFYYKVAKSLIKDIMMEVNSPEDYLINGSPSDAAFWNEITENANLDTLTERVSVKFGISVNGTVLKRYPTDAKAFHKSSNLYYDSLAQSDLPPFLPVAVLHESADSEWYYVITYGYGGWVRKEFVALCASKEEWLERYHPENFLVVTGKELRLSTDPYTEQLSDLRIPMGTKLPVADLGEAPEEMHGRIGFGNYVAKLPVRNEEGMAEDVYVLIPAAEDVNLGYLPYTEENVAKLAFKHLGSVYGWAGDNNGQDCSGYAREIYACFGYNLPRTAKAQSNIESSGSYDVSGKGYSEIAEILNDAPIGTLLYFP